MTKLKQRTKTFIKDIMATREFNESVRIGDIKNPNRYNPKRL